MTRTKELAYCIVLLVIGGLALHEWASHREEIARAEEVGKAARATAAEQAQVIAQKQADIATRDRQRDAELREIAKLRAAITTNQQAAAALPQFIDLPRAAALAGDLPNSPQPQAGDLVVPKESVLPLVQKLAECKENGIKLAACAGDRDDYRAQFWAAQKQFDAAAESAKRWEQAARGGSRLHRVWRIVKPLGCAAAGAAAGALTPQRAAGAAVGAGAGGVLCALF